MTRPRRRPPRVAPFAVLVAVGVALTSLGVAAALGTQVLQGTVESGQGAYVAEHPLTYWTWHETALGTIPAPAPARASVTAGAPTVLPRFRGSYTIDASVAGQVSVSWTFQQTTAAPVATELLITFVDGLGPPTSTVSVYVETNARALGAPATFVFYWDAGTFAPGSLVIETMTVTVQACTAIGVCP